MKFPEPKTFRGATSPVTLIKWILGIGVLEYPIGCPRRLISLWWSGTYVIFFSNSVRIILGPEYLRDMKSSHQSTYMLFIIIFPICGIIFVYLGQVKSKDIASTLCKLDKVNETLHGLGIPKEYGLLFKSQIIHLIGSLFSLCMVAGFSLIFTVYDVSPQLTSDFIVEYYTIFVSFLEDYVLITHVRYIGKRFRYLNAYLDTISIKDGNAKLSYLDLHDYIPRLSSPAIENQVQVRSGVIGDQQWMVQNLRNARKIHHDLCTIATNLNKAFGVQILLSMTLAIVTITFILFDTYNLFLESTIAVNNVVFQLLAVLPLLGIHMMKVFSIISACSMASTEAQRTGEKIHALITPTTSIEIRDEIHVFSLQLMQNPLQFTTHGFFTLDRETLGSMVETITMYLVILIQVPKVFARADAT